MKIKYLVISGIFAISTIAYILFILAATCGCVKKDERYEPVDDQYITRSDWSSDVKKAVNDLIKKNRDSENKYAVFDFDNTCSIFDIEEQLLVYQIQTMSFAMDPDEFKKAISTGLDMSDSDSYNWITDIFNAYYYLYERYGPFTPMGLKGDIQKEIQEDPQWLEFAAKTCSLYKNIGDFVSIDDAYTWILFLFAGMTDNEIYNLSYQSCKKFSELDTSEEIWKSPGSIPSLLGQVEYKWKSGVSVSKNIHELFEALDNFGIDVWICSASGMQQVLAAVDVFDLHRFCSGVLAMTLKKDKEGRYICEYDLENGRGYVSDGEKWIQHSLVNGAQTTGTGKITSISNAIAPLYGQEGPIAGFMDSTGDFNFCTEFKSLSLVVCFNRADRKITDGGGLIAEIAMYERDVLGYNLTSANKNGDTFYVLQGRDENGKRSLRNSNSTMRFGASEEKLFANEDNYAQLEEMTSLQLSVKEAIDKYSGLFMESYPGYHSR